MTHRMIVPSTRIARLGALILAVAAGATGCRSTNEAEAEPVVTVKVTRATRADLIDTLSALGTVSSMNEIPVAPKVGAVVARMGIVKGKVVKAGDVVATLESGDLRAAAAEADAAVREARATLKQTSGGTTPEADAQRQKALQDAIATLRNAEALYRRRKMLFERGGIAQKDLDDAELALKQAESAKELAERESSLAGSNLNPTNRDIAESRLKQAEDRADAAHVQLEYATVRSPISGVITAQFHQDGEFVAAGEKLFTVTDTRVLVVKAQFPDNGMLGIRTGAVAAISPSSGGEDIEGKVTLVSRTADPASRTVEVWVEVPEGSENLRVGDFAKVSITVGEATGAVTVPPAAVTFEDPTADTGTVMVVDEQSVAHETEVTVGIRTDEALEISKGLEDGVTVIVEGNYALPDGTKVRQVEAAPAKDGAAKEEKEDSDEESGT